MASLVKILRDLRQGLLRTERPMKETAIFYTKGAPPYQDDTYMYDDDVGEAGAGGGAGVGAGGVLGAPHPHHWYDEPPYESDPEDFLIGKDAYREPYNRGVQVVVTEEDIISLRTAGDISVPRDVAKVAQTQWQPGVAYPQRVRSSRVEAAYPGDEAFPVPVYDNVRVVSFSSCRGRGTRRCEPEYHNVGGAGRGAARRNVRPIPRDVCSDDAGGVDVSSVTSRLSGVSVETNRSDPTELRLSKYMSRSSMSGGSEDGQSPSHSSDYEEQDEAERSGSASRIVGRMRGFGRDMQKKISRLKSPRGSTSSSPGPPEGLDQHRGSLTTPGTPSHPPATSCESLPSPVPPPPPAGSNRSSLSGENAEPYTGPFIGRARALVDCYPSPYDRDALKFKKGDTIDIIAKNLSGLWKGCVDGRVGHFKFILVEEEVERPARKSRSGKGKTPRRGRSRTLEELLDRLHLSHLIQVFTFNGYEDLDHFRELEKADLDCLGITDPETCAKLLTAVALLHDADSEPEDLPEKLETTEAALRRGDHGRDSGCYTDHRCSTQPQSTLEENNLDTRQSTPSTDTSSGYHSRGNLNIPVEGQAMRDTLDSSSSEATTTTSGTATLPSSSSESHSYRAHPATVLPASPHTQARPQARQEQEVDYENKFEAARSVFEKEVVKREVPVSIRGQKPSVEPKQVVSEAEKVGSSDAGGSSGGTESPP